jgi:hypothetical protein
VHNTHTVGIINIIATVVGVGAGVVGVGVVVTS